MKPFLYDTPFEVTEEQYHRLMTGCREMLAGMTENGRYFIKVWLVSRSNFIRKVGQLHGDVEYVDKSVIG